MELNEWLSEDIAKDIWNKKYRNGQESFEQWLNRVSGGDEDVKELIRNKKFLFGGRILSNRGLQKDGKKITLSNCYVIEPPADNLESIFDCATKLARTFSYGGGCGIDISNLSPRGAGINNAAKSTSGAVSFMELYSMVTGLIGQAGRRGALMISISCDHPDLEEFIELKSDLDKVTKANISIRVTDKFMEAVKNNEEYELEFTREETGETISKTVNARSIFNKFAKMNWDYAEPAFLFWDRIENWNLLSNTKDFKFSGVNPCAEEPLPSGGSCLLGSINLSEFVMENGRFDFRDFRKTVQIAVKALNDVLDEGLPLHPLKEQRDSVRDWRQIGLGIFGLADMLIKMGIEYGSEDSIYTCKCIAEDMINFAVEESSILARQYGSYPKYNYEEVCSTDFFKDVLYDGTKESVKEFGLRNSQLLTIAPTGTLSTMLGVSGGIEPVFANYYERKTESLHDKDVIYKVYTPIVKKYMEENNLQDDCDLPDYFITSQNLNYKKRIDMQSIWQHYIDASISSTVNVPNNFTVEEVEGLYEYAHEKGLKGVTIFREGCKRLGILTTNSDEDDFDSEKLNRGDILDVNDDVIGLKRKLTTGCGSLHCSAFFDPIDGTLLETYFSKGSSGGCNSFMIGLSRMISLASRGGVDIDCIIDQLNSCGNCPSYAVRSATKRDTSKGSSCPTAIGQALKDMWLEVRFQLGLAEEDLQKNNNEEYEIINPCPQCGAELQFSGGCNFCPECSYSKCD